MIHKTKEKNISYQLKTHFLFMHSIPTEIVNKKKNKIMWSGYQEAETLSTETHDSTYLRNIDFNLGLAIYTCVLI
jgi:hypothetical protein